MKDKIVRNISEEPIVGIYLITNVVNGKVYLGQSIDIERRWNQHRYGKGSIILRNAIKKYGINSFEFSIVEEIDISNKNKLEIQKLLIVLEQKWLDDKKPFMRENGYNIQSSAKPNIPIKRPDGYGDLISKIKIDNNHCGKSVIQYTKDGVLIKEWKSAAEIERELGYHAENISACCLNKEKSSNNFIWQFSDVKLTNKKIKDVNYKAHHYKKVNMLSLDGTILTTFNSVREASEYVKCPSYQISKVCTGKQTTCRGYKWEFLSD